MVGAGLGCAILPAMSVRKERGRNGLLVRALSPRLYRRLAVVVRRDKPLHAGLGDLFHALKDLKAQAALDGD
jgi:DNA-binding transcriptional LysR family regulator